MKQLEYKAPAMEVITLEVEGIIAFSKPGSEPCSKNVKVTKESSINSSYSMDDYNWQ